MIADKCILLTLNVEKITIKTSSYSKYGQNLDEPLKHFQLHGVFLSLVLMVTVYIILSETQETETKEIQNSLTEMVNSIILLWI